VTAAKAFARTWRAGNTWCAVRTMSRTERCAGATSSCTHCTETSFTAAKADSPREAAASPRRWRGRSAFSFGMNTWSPSSREGQCASRVLSVSLRMGGSPCKSRRMDVDGVDEWTREGMRVMRANLMARKSRRRKQRASYVAVSQLRGLQPHPRAVRQILNTMSLTSIDDRSIKMTTATVAAKPAKQPKPLPAPNSDFQDGRPLPGVAQVAIQQGRYVGGWRAIVNAVRPFCSHVDVGDVCA
jgi:hypothetical protein